MLGHATARGFGWAGVDGVSLLSLALILVCSCLLPMSDGASQKLVQVSVSAPWGAAPLVMEASEFFLGDNFWAYAEALPVGVIEGTDKQQYDAVLTAASKITTAAQVDLLNFALAIREGSPKLEAHRSMWIVAKDQGCSIDTPAGAVALVGDQCISDVGAVREAVQRCTKEEISTHSVHDIDHVHPSSPDSDSAPTVILYATLGSDAFVAWHTELAKLAGEKAARYVLRHTWSKWRKEKTPDCVEESLPLQGYGAELAVKNMEYKAVDDTKVDAEEQAIDGVDLEADQVGGFDFKKLLERRPDLADELRSFRDTLQSELSQSDDIKVWNLKDLGIQASQHIMKAREPLRLMRDLSHNLPSLVRSLSRLKVNPSVRDEIEANHQIITPGMNLVLLNGRQIDADDTTPFALLNMLRFEIEGISRLTTLGMDVSSARKIIMAPSRNDDQQQQQGPKEWKIDINKGEHVFWMNDLENDSMYKGWPKGFDALLTRGWPGQLKYIARNLYTAIYVVNPGSDEGLRTIVQCMRMKENSIPVRFGFLFESKETLLAYSSGEPQEINTAAMSEGEKVGRIFAALYDRHGPQAAFEFVNKYWTSKQTAGSTQGAQVGDEVLEEARKGAFKETTKQHRALEKKIKAKYQAVLNSTDGAQHLVNSTRYVRSTGLSAAEGSKAVVNGVLLESADEDFLMYTVQMQLMNLQRMAYFGQLREEKNIYPQLVGSDAIKRYHKLIVPGASTSTLTLSSDAASLLVAQKNYPWLNCQSKKDDVRAISHLIAVDLGSDVGRELLVEALDFVLDSKVKLCHQTRLAFVDNAASGDADAASAMRAMQQAIRAFASSKEKDVGQLKGQAKTIVSLLKSGKWTDAAADDTVKHLLVADGDGVPAELQKTLAQGMGLGAGESAVATGGRVFRVSADVPFVAGDFGLAGSTEFRSTLKEIRKVVGGASFPGVPSEDVTTDFLSSAVFGCGCVVAAQAKEKVRRQEINSQWRGKMTGFSVGPEDALIQITAFLDPLCKATQRVAPLLMTVADGFNARVQVFLNPQVTLTDVPIKGYFRYVLKPRLQFDESGALRASHRAVFNNLPTSKLLTMNLHAPDAWFVEAQRCAYDMDNILLDNLPESESILSASYVLDHLLLTGHATDERMAPPAGLQLALEHSSKAGDAHKIISDTIVMSNLGYFQLKASPGVWRIQCAAGKSRELYNIQGTGVEDGMPVTVASFEPEILNMRVAKQKGKEHLSLISEEMTGGEDALAAETSSLWSSFTGMFGGGEAAAPAPTPDRGAVARAQGLDTIHVFSLASGHLYERFLKIMMLSVVRNTKNPVKFWLLRNFLSPQFKESIGAYARKHGFEYELVTYKWPSWLHGQTEKQRIIWGYKILMLDVLFPLSVPKIIYIDSDQVVRADLNELWSMDLKGRSLAYTPFCDSNKEMEGYRFWKQGFWASHLQNHKYHISALYVVDLNRYSQLSRDPNSLANLDQDLPNYAQHAVPIYSLPQEWLWCETWCSNETKPKAKTIDLCNNPMTKEPKLDQAKRIIAEWVELDETARTGTDLS